MGFVSRYRRGRPRTATKASIKVRRPAKRVAVATLNQVNAIVRRTQEIRNYQYYNLLDATNDEGQVSNPLFNYQQGDNNGYRSGNSIYVNKIDFHFLIKARHESIHQCRVIIFKWNEDTLHTAPTSVGILQTLATGGPLYGAGAFVDAHYNLETRKSYKILYDKTMLLAEERSSTLTDGSGTIVGNGNVPTTLSFKVSLRNLGQVDYTGSSTEVYGIGQVYVMCLSDLDPSLNAETPQVEYVTQTVYTA